MLLRRFLLGLCLSAGIAVPAFAGSVSDGWCDSYWPSASAAMAFASSHPAYGWYSGSWETPYDMRIAYGNDAAWLSSGNACYKSGSASGCLSPTPVLGSDGSCIATPAAPACAVGQSGNPCVPDAPAPIAGSDAEISGVVMGSVDAAGNHVWSGAAQETLFANGTLFYNCGGWECSVELTGFSHGVDGCTYPTGGGALYCNFVPVYTGNPAAVGQSLRSAASFNGGSNASATATGCSAGSTLDPITGLCSTAGTPGTASTTVSSGTAPTAGTQSCPTGFTATLGGTCEGPPATGPLAATNGGCPAGYTLTGGKCVGSGVLGASGAGLTAACGGPGQPMCAIGDPSAHPFPSSDSWISSGFSSFTSLFMSVGSTSLNHGWNWGINSLNLPTPSCSSWVIATGGRRMEFDVCPVAEKIRDIGAFVFYVMTVFGLLNILTGSSKGEV